MIPAGQKIKQKSLRGASRYWEDNFVSGLQGEGTSSASPQRADERQILQRLEGDFAFAGENDVVGDVGIVDRCWSGGQGHGRGFGRVELLDDDRPEGGLDAVQDP